MLHIVGIRGFEVDFYLGIEEFPVWFWLAVKKPEKPEIALLDHAEVMRFTVEIEDVEQLHWLLDLDADLDSWIMTDYAQNLVHIIGDMEPTILEAGVVRPLATGRPIKEKIRETPKAQMAHWPVEKPTEIDEG